MPAVVLDSFALLAYLRQETGWQTVRNALHKAAEGSKIEPVQRHRAESDLAVAAASILAREVFLRSLYEIGPEGAAVSKPFVGRFRPKKPDQAEGSGAE